MTSKDDSKGLVSLSSFVHGKGGRGEKEGYGADDCSRMYSKFKLDWNTLKSEETFWMGGGGLQGAVFPLSFSPCSCREYRLIQFEQVKDRLPLHCDRRAI